MKIIVKDDPVFSLRFESEDKGLAVLEIKLPYNNNEIELWLLPFELEQLKEVLNV